MRVWIGVLASAAILCTACGAQKADGARWAGEAQRVSITRDDWGIAHVHGKSDADAVFGMIYAQCEDDFPRVERNYLTSLGRTAEADGEKSLWQDLRQKLFIDPVDLKKEYSQSPLQMRVLMDAWADGLNFYLARNPQVKPQVLTRFEPWMALSFTEGSIGGDIERIDLTQLQQFYGKTDKPQQLAHETTTATVWEREPGGSNGIAIAPANTTHHHALLLINPHTSFFFRSELQMTSDEGLNAYGAVTWGQFFVYQGFNEHAGWMHTSSGVDAVDRYVQNVTPTASGFSYRYGKQVRPLTQKKITVAYRTPSGMATRDFVVFNTHRGPVISGDRDRWTDIRLMQEHVKALEQSFLRTKANSYAEYTKTMELQANSSNNTIFADQAGDIAYWHGNYIPRRDPHFDFTQPLDGSNPATDWHGLLSVAASPHLLSPSSGWLFNVNDSPWNGAGTSSLRKADFPAYVETGSESARGLHAIRVLTGKRDFTLESLTAAAYDSYLPWFQKLVPALLQAWNALPDAAPLKQKLAPQITVLRAWDLRWSEQSIATSIAIFWGTELRHRSPPNAGNTWLDEDEGTGHPAAPSLMLDALKPPPTGSAATSAAGRSRGVRSIASSGSTTMPSPMS